MMFSTVVFRTAALLMLGSAAAWPTGLQSRGSKIIIGYRTVSNDEADKINKAGTLVKVETKGIQIGTGIYLSNGLGDWAGAANGQWCVIQADKDAMGDQMKAWIARTQFDAGDDKIDNYIKGLNSDFDPSKTLRMSTLLREPGQYQLVVPFDLLGTNFIITHTKGPLSLEAYCKPKADVQKDPSLLPSQRIDYTSDPFNKNYAGTQQ